MRYINWRLLDYVGLLFLAHPVHAPKCVWWLGSARTRCGSLQRSPRPLAELRGDGRRESENGEGEGKGRGKNERAGPPTVFEVHWRQWWQIIRQHTVGLCYVSLKLEVNRKPDRIEKRGVAWQRDVTADHGCPQHSCIYKPHTVWVKKIPPDFFGHFSRTVGNF